VNRQFLDVLCDVLGITTPMQWSWEFSEKPEPSERLVHFCQQVGAGRYLSGPTAKAYMHEGPFDEAGIEVAYMDYSGYRPYPQLFPPFEHHVSILDLILNTGPAARDYLLPLPDATPQTALQAESERS
jgi:hypothetical protein